MRADPEIKSTFFSPPKNVILKTWWMDGRCIQLILEVAGRLSARVKSDNQSQTIYITNIEGIPIEVSYDVTILKKFIKNSYVKLVPLSDDTYKLYILPSMKGGGNTLSTDLIQNYKRAHLLWPNAIIPYMIDYEKLSPQQITIIMSAITKWNDVSAQTGFKLIPQDNLENYDDYVKFTLDSQCDYSCMVLNNKTAYGFCKSFVGREGGEQLINCDINEGQSCEFNIGSVMHEIGHAIGLVHEHQRLDREEFISVYYPYTLYEEDDSDENKHWKVNYKPKSKVHGDYDFDSIMHYRTDISLNDGVDIIVRNNLPQNYSYTEGIVIGHHDILSQGDIAAAKSLAEAAKHAPRILYGMARTNYDSAVTIYNEAKKDCQREDNCEKFLMQAIYFLNLARMELQLLTGRFAPAISKEASVIHDTLLDAINKYSNCIASLYCKSFLSPDCSDLMVSNGIS